jgi:uncharacterized protein
MEPAPTPRWSPGFADGLDRGELQVQICRSCERSQFPGRIVCSTCGGRDLEWRPAARSGELYAVTTVQKSFSSEAPSVPFRVGLARMDEGFPFVAVVAPGSSMEIGSRVELRVNPVPSNAGTRWTFEDATTGVADSEVGP